MLKKKPVLGLTSAGKGGVFAVSRNVCQADNGAALVDWKLELSSWLGAGVTGVVHQDLASFGADEKCSWLVQVPAAAPHFSADHVPLDLAAGADVGQSGRFVLRH